MELWELKLAGAYKRHHTPLQSTSVCTPSACVVIYRASHVTSGQKNLELGRKVQSKQKAEHCFVCLLLAQEPHACSIGGCTDSGQAADLNAQHILHLHASQVHLMTGIAALAWSQASCTCVTQPLKCEAACSHAAASTHATAAILLTCGRERVDKAQSICCQWPSTRNAAAAQRSSSSLLGAGGSPPAPGATSFHGYANR